MNNKIIIGIVLAILVVGGLFYFMRNPYQSQPSSGGPTQAPAKVEANTIIIQNFSFNPSTLTVKQGAKATWINEDSAIHRIKSENFNSQDLAQGDKFEFTFKNKGSFDYICGIHPSMQGKIVVE
jgi:plastocyanin